MYTFFVYVFIFKVLGLRWVSSSGGCWCICSVSVSVGFEMSHYRRKNVCVHSFCVFVFKVLGLRYRVVEDVGVCVNTFCVCL